MGGGDELQITGAQRKDPVTTARERELWFQAEKYADTQPFSSRYGTEPSAFPGLGRMSQAGQQYMTDAILGPGQYGARSLGFADYQAPEGTRVAPYSPPPPLPPAPAMGEPSVGVGGGGVTRIPEEILDGTGGVGGAGGGGTGDYGGYGDPGGGTGDGTGGGYYGGVGDGSDIGDDAGRGERRPGSTGGRIGPGIPGEQFDGTGGLGGLGGFGGVPDPGSVSSQGPGFAGFSFRGPGGVTDVDSIQTFDVPPDRAPQAAPSGSLADQQAAYRRGERLPLNAVMPTSSVSMAGPAPRAPGTDAASVEFNSMVDSGWDPRLGSPSDPASWPQGNQPRTYWSDEQKRAAQKTEQGQRVEDRRA